MSAEIIPTPVPVPESVKRGRGRPKGVKNKSKITDKTKITDVPKTGQETKKADFSIDDKSIKDLLKSKPAEDVKKEEQAQDKALDGIFATIEAVWNNAADAEPGQVQDFHWKKEDSTNLKNAITLLDAKYGFIGKSLNYIPELVFGVTICMIALKAYAMMKHKGEQQPQRRTTSPGIGNQVRVGESELDRWAREEAAKPRGDEPPK